MNTNFAGSMKKDASGRTLVSVTFGDGRTTIFSTPADIPVEWLHRLTLAHNPKKHRGSDYITRMSFIDPIAQSESANDRPVKIVEHTDYSYLLPGRGMERATITYRIEGDDHGDVPSVREDRAPVPSGRRDTGEE